MLNRAINNDQKHYVSMQCVIITPSVNIVSVNILVNTLAKIVENISD